MIPILQVRDVLHKVDRWIGQGHLANNRRSTILSPQSDSRYSLIAIGSNLVASHCGITPAASFTGNKPARHTTASSNDHTKATVCVPSTCLSVLYGIATSVMELYSESEAEWQSPHDLDLLKTGPSSEDGPAPSGTDISVSLCLTHTHTTVCLSSVGLPPAGFILLSSYSLPKLSGKRSHLIRHQGILQ